MSQANVYTSVSNALWYTDKCRISTSTTPITYQVYATGLGDAPAVGNLYSGPPMLGAFEYLDIYVGVGNYLTITGANYTAEELGTQSSAQAGTGNFTEQLTPSPTINGSALFDGTNYLSLTTKTAFGFGTGDFTFEGWYYHTTGAANHRLFDFRTTTPQLAPMLGIGTSNNVYLYINGATVINAGNNSMPTNAWTHIAVAKASNSTKLFINGTQAGVTYADTNNYGTTCPCYMGADYGGANGYVGYMSNMRVVKGVGVYTSNFASPVSNLTATQLANVNGNPSAAITGTQTSLLLNTYSGAGFLTDSSTNNFTVTNTGSVTSSTSAPF